jgi:hypothetical protein
MEGNQKKADASVKKSKAFFLIGLTVTAIATAIGSGYLVAQSETKTFEEKVRAGAIFNGTNTIVKKRVVGSHT